MELNVATQVTTYAHSTHVARLAEAMMKAIIRHRRELLVGKLGINSKWQVRLHQRQDIGESDHNSNNFFMLSNNS